MPAIIEIDGHKYIGTLSPGAVETMEDLANKGLGLIAYGIMTRKLSDMVIFTYSCIADQLPLGTTKDWLWEHLHILDSEESILTATHKMLDFYNAVMQRDKQRDSGDEKNEQAPPTDGGPTSETSSTAS